MQQVTGLNAYLQVGSLSIMDDDYARYNSSFLITPEARIQSRYNKVRLVPFGEYIPLSNLVEKLTGLSIVSPLPGDEFVIFRKGEISWKTVICSEILYPGLVREGVEEARFIVNQSNEAWYRKGNLQEQMWIAARFRAAENRRSILKAGNQAFGGVIAPTGAELMKNHSRDLSTFPARLPLNGEGTLYQKWGDYPGFISAIVLVFSLLTKSFLNLRRKKAGERSGNFKFLNHFFIRGDMDSLIVFIINQARPGPPGFPYIFYQGIIDGNIFGVSSLAVIGSQYGCFFYCFYRDFFFIFSPDYNM